MENYETHKELFQLPKYVIPIGLLCFGYPTKTQKDREKTRRFEEGFIHFINRYRRLDEDEFTEMFAEMREQRMSEKVQNAGITNLGELMYTRKLGAEYAVEMSRSVRAMLKAWTEE
jgi:hypothetical protein